MIVAFTGNKQSKDTCDYLAQFVSAETSLRGAVLVRR